MNDPYQVLGVSRAASEDDIKKAYRRLSRMYHPDANIGKSEREQQIAEEKFKEIQAAYKAIMDGSANGYASSYGRQGANRATSQRNTYGNPFGSFFTGGYQNAAYQKKHSYSSADQEQMYFRAVETFLKNRMYAEAMRSLNDIPNRTGKWFFYAAMASAGMGDMKTSQEYIDTAIVLEPGNPDYRNFKSRMGDAPGWYTEVGKSYGTPETQNNNVCLYVIMGSLCCGGPCGGIPLCCI